MQCVTSCVIVVLVVCLPSNASSSVANTPGIVRNTNFRFIDVCKKTASRATSNGTRAMTAPSATYCARHCLADPNCSSFNWKLADHLCELIPRSDQTPVYQNNTDFVHYSPSVCPGFTPPEPEPEWMGKWQKFNGSQIMVCRQKEPTLTWTAARELCRGMQADLVDLTKPRQHFHMVDMIPANSALQAWVGCSRVGSRWEWVTSGLECPKWTVTPGSGDVYVYVNIYDGLAEFKPVVARYTRDSFICEKK